MPSARFSSDTFTCRRSACGGDGEWVQVAGELEVSTAGELEQTLREALHDASLVVLDLRQVTFMDLIGLRVILEADQRARGEGRALTVLPGPQEVVRVLELTGTIGQVSVVDPGQLAAYR